MFWPWCSVSVGVSGLDAFRDASAMCQLRFSTSNCASHLVGLSDVSKARFQPWLSSHALAMSLRVKLDHSSSMSPEARECANQLSPWFLTLFCDSSFNDQFWTDFRCYWPLRFPTWGPTLLSLSSGLRRSASQTLSFVLLSAASTFLEVCDLGGLWHSYCGASLSVFSTISLTSAQRARNTAWAATCLFSGRFLALCFTPQWHQGCVQKPCSAMFFQLALKSIRASGPKCLSLYVSAQTRFLSQFLTSFCDLGLMASSGQT